MEGTLKQISYARELQCRAGTALDKVLEAYSLIAPSAKLARATEVANIVRVSIVNCEQAGDVIDLLKGCTCTAPAIMAAIKFGTGRLAMSIKSAIKEVQ